MYSDNAGAIGRKMCFQTRLLWHDWHYAIDKLKAAIPFLCLTFYSLVILKFLRSWKIYLKQLLNFNISQPLLSVYWEMVGYIISYITDHQDILCLTLTQWFSNFLDYNTIWKVSYWSGTSAFVINLYLRPNFIQDIFSSKN